MGSQDFLLSAMMDELLPRKIMREKKKGASQVPQDNLCENNGIFTCKATDTSLQSHCRYFFEFFSSGRCLFYNSAGCCDNPEAQKNACQRGMG